MLSDKSTVCPINLLDVAHQKRGVKAAIVNAGKTLPMLSVMDAVREDLIVPTFIGNKEEIEKCASDLKFDISKLPTPYVADVPETIIRSGNFSCSFSLSSLLMSFACLDVVSRYLPPGFSFSAFSLLLHIL